MGRKQRMLELFQALEPEDQLTVIEAGEALLLSAPFAVAFDGRTVCVTGGKFYEADQGEFYEAVVGLLRAWAGGAPWRVSVGPAADALHATPESLQ